jgi:hypothetical protein
VLQQISIRSLGFYDLSIPVPTCPYEFDKAQARRARRMRHETSPRQIRPGMQTFRIGFDSTISGVVTGWPDKSVLTFTEFDYSGDNLMHKSWA